MDYCLDAGDGTAAIWTSAPDVDLDGDGEFDAVRMDLDGDGLFDDALGDGDGDGTAERAIRDLEDGGGPPYTDDGTGTWTLSGGLTGRPLRWFTVDGTEQEPGAGDGAGDGDVDGDGLGERLIDVDLDGLADRALAPGGERGYVDTDGDGRWDVMLADTDGDGSADAADAL